jgi:endo-1,4-beta-mannosidase
VFKKAAKYGDRLIPVLANEWGPCDGVNDQPGVQKGDAFFTGFRTNTDEGPLTYWKWVRAIVGRYGRSPTVYAWEPINEAQICDVPESQAVTDLTDFYTAVGDKIHALAPGSRVEEGLSGSGQCGTEDGDYATVGASPGVDILSYHDYYGATSPIGGDQYNGIAVRIAQAQATGKPIIAGEMGIAAGIGCPVSLDQRAADYSTKIAAQTAAGTAGVLLWDWYPGATASCVYENITTGDPSLSLLSAG